jgi:outer membrane protein assembly factor BamB
MRLKVYAILVAAALAVTAQVAMAQSHWAIARTLPVGGDGGWDYGALDTASGHLFLTRFNRMDIVESSTGNVVASLPGLKAAHGVALVPKLHRGFVTDGGSGEVVVFDMTTGAKLGALKAIPDVDDIHYDAAMDRVFVASGDGNALLSFAPEIDLKADAMDEPIALGGAPEALTSDGKDTVYVNLADKNLVAVVSVRQRKVLARWPVAPGGRPVSIALDAAHHRLYVGCRNPQQLVVFDTESGKVVGSAPIGAGTDAAAFANGHAFVSCGEGQLVIASFHDGQLVIDQTLATQKGSRIVVADESGRTLYLPAAEFEPATTGRPKVKPGSFTVLVVAEQ